MATIHKVLIMKVPVGKFFTARHPNGMLSSSINIGDILRKQLPPEEFIQKKRGIMEMVAPKNCVVYDRDLLDEPELDDMLADNIGYMYRFSNIDVCRPNIILLMRDYKKKPAAKATINGYHHIINMFFSRHLPTDLRFKAYKTFNKAIDVDKRNGTNTFFPLLQLFWLHFPNTNGYIKLIDEVWIDPQYDPGQKFDWEHFVLECSGTLGNFGSTPYYNDDRFIGIVNNLYDKNKAMLFRTMVNRFGEHPPRFRKTG